MGQATTCARHDPLGVSRPARQGNRTFPKDSEQSPMTGRAILWLSAATLAWLAWTVAHGKYYTPRSGFGFYLGVVGTVMMVALLAYPLRKSMRWMHRWGAVKHWFRVHMILGVIGPILVVFHSTFQIRSPNAAVALGSMLVVVISGLVGRFVYTQIHDGLYGSRASLEKVQEEFSGRAGSVKVQLQVAPQVEAWLQKFERVAMRRDRSVLGGLWHFLSLGVMRQMLTHRCRRALRRLSAERTVPGISIQLREIEASVSAYLRGVQRVAQFSSYERLFSLWHVLHVPLIYLLAASTIFHVIAVYMY